MDDSAQKKLRESAKNHFEARRRIKLRNLRRIELSNTAETQNTTIIALTQPAIHKTNRKCMHIMCTLVLCLAGIFYYHNKLFQTHVIQILNEHSDDSCHNVFDGSTILAHLRQNIVQQDMALSHMERILGMHKEVSAMSLVGRSGTGKSLTTTIFQEHFPWPRNVIPFVWPISKLQQHELLFDLVFSQLSKCGHNLLVIDSISPESELQISILHYAILDYLTSNRLKAIVIYVFSVPSFMLLDDDHHSMQLEDSISRLVRSHNVDGIQPVIFQPITSAQAVRQCVAKAQLQLGLSELTSRQIKEIVDSIDAPRSGCKLVYAKTALYT